MDDEGMGRIVRVQMHAEASSLEECQRALNAGFMTIHGAVLDGLTSSVPTSVNTGYSSVFSRETEFGDEVFESQVRRHDGAIYYRGRRTISFVEPTPGLEEDMTAVLVRGTLISDDDRIRRIQMMPECGSVDVVRLMNGVWFCTVYEKQAGIVVTESMAGERAEVPPSVVLANGQGGTLREAIDETEATLEARGLLHGGTLIQ